MIAVVQAECGARPAWTAYAAASVLGVLLVPDKETALFFVALLGYYPLVKPWFDRLRPAVLRVGAKLLLCNGAVAVLYGVLLLLFPVAESEAVSRYAGIEISDEDVYTLACLAYHEARGEPFEGQVAVIEVALNRCLSDYFPDTVEEVVFQKCGDVWQFSPAPYLYTAEPTETRPSPKSSAARRRQGCSARRTYTDAPTPGR